MMFATLCLPHENEMSDPAETTTGQWSVVRTYTSREAAVAERLTAQGFDCFNPIERVRQVRAGRIEEKDRPFYPTYLFACWGDEYQRHDIRRTKYVADVLKTANTREQLRLERDIDSLRTYLAMNPLADVTDWCQRGRRVRVVRGPYENLEGEIIRRERKVKGKTVVKDLLCVGVFTLGRVVEIEMPDPSFVEPI
jgi:transcription antitermination factor NusG